VLLCDGDGTPLSPPKFYHEPASERADELLARAVGDAETGVPATLGRVADLWSVSRPEKFHISHQADWIAGWFCGRFDFSDENNALKLGYDPARQAWNLDPAELPFSADALPNVCVPARVVGTVSTSMAAISGLTPGCRVYTGTTDGIAGFVAVSGLGGLRPGTAVTSLGTTMIIKAISPCQADVGAYGIYSHKLFDNWVAGGASNSGGGALLKHFTPDQMKRLSERINSEVASELDHYPLTGRGERFPV